MNISEITFSLSRTIPGAEKFEMHKPMVSVTMTLTEEDELSFALSDLKSNVYSAMDNIEREIRASIGAVNAVAKSNGVNKGVPY